MYEKSYTDENGQTVSIIYSRSREAPLCLLPEIDVDADPAFSTENATPFSTFNPDLKQTGIFIDRFFHKFSYKDLAVKYETSPYTARTTYHNAVKRIKDVLQIMDNYRTVKQLAVSRGGEELKITEIRKLTPKEKEEQKKELARKRQQKYYERHKNRILEKRRQ